MEYDLDSLNKKLRDIQEKLDRAMEDLMELLDMDDEEELEDFLT